MKKIETEKLKKVVGGNVGKEKDDLHFHLDVQCTYCGQYFTPTEHEVDLSNAICDNCKKNM